MTAPQGEQPAAAAYRREIDGLRAIAVMAVIVAHSGLGWLPGGFAGVDVFFVISGYLITGILLRELASDSFSFRRFYARRARRILPALFVMLAVCWVAAAFLMTPSQFKDHALAQASTVIFLSNAYFWSLFGYFSPNAAEQPLLHTWSLAVEEQFYLLFPLLLLLLWRLGRMRAVAAGVVLMALLSLAVSEWGWRHKPEANYFFSLSRFWELLAGSLCAAIERRRPPTWPVLAWVGLALLLGSLVLLNESLPFPSVYALAPVAGTALLLLHARAGTGVAQLLSWPGLTGVGLISYSAYLWHQPVFALAHLRGWLHGGSAGLWVSLALIALVLLLGWLSWRLVELPWRHGVQNVRPDWGLGRRGVAALGVASAGVLFAGGLAEQYTSTILWRFAPEDRPLVSLSRKDAKKYLHAHTRSVEAVPFTDDGGRRVLVVGDSFGKDLINALHESGLDRGLQVSFHGIPAECGNLLLDRPEAEVLPPGLGAACDGVDRYRSPGLLARVAAADVVVLASYWQPWQVPWLKDSVGRLQRITQGRVLLLGPKSFGRPDVNRLLALTAAERQAWRQPPDGITHQTHKAIEALGIDGFVDVQTMVCEGGQACPAVGPTGHLLSEDGVHLTRAGAVWLGERLRGSALHAGLHRP